MSSLKYMITCTLCLISSNAIVASATPPVKQSTSSINLSASAFQSAQAFGARGDGKTDDTKALQAAIDKEGLIVLPKGTYRTTATLFIRADNTVLIGHGPSATIIRYEGTGPAITSAASTMRTLYWCRLFGLRIEAANQNQTGPLINWTSMQFGTLQDLWIKGSGVNSIGIVLNAIPKKTEATYNVISHSYIGFVGTGIVFGYGANSNTVETSRIQPLAGGVGIILRGQMSNNHIINTGIEYPGNVSGGILIDGDVHNTLIQGNRFEGLAYGWKVSGPSVNTMAIGNYYDSIDKNTTWVNQSISTKNLDVTNSH